MGAAPAAVWSYNIQVLVYIAVIVHVNLNLDENVIYLRLFKRPFTSKIQTI